MAVLIEADGKETMGGITAIRDAFQAASQGKLACNRAAMRYAQGNAQVLEFSGVWCADGKPFKVTSDAIPAGAPLAPHARAMARELIA